MNRSHPAFSCPIPIVHHERILMAHGGGGRLMHQLIESVFLRPFGNPVLNAAHDSAQFLPPKGRLAFTTDSYVVNPIFFPGGDIGSLSVHGTVNDLAMSGARPIGLSCAFVIEEGLSMETLSRVAHSLAQAAASCGVPVVTGDTKVVERGKCDSIFINTSGIGIMEHSLSISPQGIRPGDAILLSGDLGRHGMAVMALREGLQFESTIESDSAPVHEPVLAMIQAGVSIHCLRDLTRSGLSAALNELAEASGLALQVEESLIPVNEDVHSACELLGLDPLCVANEGRFIAFIPAAESEMALNVLRSFQVSANAVCIGKVMNSGDPAVLIKSRMGSIRLLDMPSGELLPRIC